MGRILQPNQVADAFVAVPGINVEMLNDTGGATTTTSASFEDMTGYGGSFYAPVAGQYLLTFVIDGFATGSATSARFRLVFDAAGTPQNIGNDDESWELNTGASPDTRAYKTMQALVELTAGIHTVKVQWKRVFGSGTWNSDVLTNALVRGTLVSGSGAAGILYDESPALAVNHPVTTGFADIDNGGGDKLEVTVDTIEGERVLMLAQLRISQTSQGDTALRFTVDGSAEEAYNWSQSNSSAWNELISISQVSSPQTAGSHTFVLQAQRNNASAIWAGAKIGIVRYRGGQVPIQQGGVSVIDTPRALNFLGALVETDATGIADIHMGSTTPPAVISVEQDPPSSPTTVNSTTYTLIMDGGTIEVPCTGKYRVDYTAMPLVDTSGIGSLYVKVVIDEGLSTEVVLESDKWRYRGTAQDDYVSLFFSDFMDLTIGSRTLKVYGKVVGGSQDFDFYQLDANQSQQAITFMMVGGSGAGGTLLDESAKTSDQSYTSGSETVLTELDLAVSTIADEEISIEWLIHTMNSSSTWYTRVLYYRIDSGTWQILQIESQPYWYTMSGAKRIVPGAGNHTIQFAVESDANFTVLGGDTKPGFCTEYPVSRTQVTRYRGGLVPVQQGGESVVDTPTAFNFLGALVENVGGRADIHMGATAPGILLESASIEFSGGDSIASNTFARIDDGTAEGDASFTLEVPVAGKYLLTLYQTWIPLGTGTGEVDFRVNVDSGDQYVGAANSGTTTKTTPDDWTWRDRMPGANNRHHKVFAASVELAAGSHTFEVEWARHSGTETAGVNQYDKCKITLQNITGSGAGGWLVDKYIFASDSDAITTLEPSWQTVQDGAVDVTIPNVSVSEGEVLLCTYTGRAYKNSTTQVVRALNVTYDDGGGEVYLHSDACSNTYQDYNSDAGFAIPTPELSAGTYTFRLKGNRSTHVADWALMEGGVFAIYRLRGGLVPVQKDDTSIVDTPAALNFTGPGASVTNVGGKANIALSGTEGIDAEEHTLLANFSASLASTWEHVDNGGGDEMTCTVTVNQDERVLVIFQGRVERGGANSLFQLRVTDNGTPIDTPATAHSQDLTNANMSFCRVTDPLAAGSHTFELELNHSRTDGYVYAGSVFQVVRIKGGYVQAENVPILQWNSGDLDVINIVPGPGADSELRVTLNDGIRRKSSSSLSVDLDVSGLGGLDTGSQASSTWYHVYLVPDSIDGLLNAVASVTDPDSGGPTGYDVWRWIGSVRNNGSSNIRMFWQIGNRFYSEADDSDSELVLLSASSPTTGSWVNLSTALAAAVPTAVADKALVRGYLDGDPGQVSALRVEPGNPPGFTPSESNEGESSFNLCRVQDSSQNNASRWIELFDGTLSYYLAQVLGSGGINVGLSATAWSSSRLGAKAVIRERYYEQVQAETSNKTLTPDDSRKTLTNEGATGQIDFTLPPAADGLCFTFCVVANQILKIITDSTADDIRIAASITAGASRYIQANTVGNTVKILAVSDALWLAVASHGTWTFST
jgi:hypothetical protein